MPALLLSSPRDSAPAAATPPNGKSFSIALPATRHALLAALAGYTCVALLSSIAIVLVMELWRAPLAVPWSNVSDSLLTQMWLKGIAEHGWYLTNPSLGAPGGMFMHDFPMADNLHFFLLKLMIVVTHSAPASANLYYALGFPAAAVAAAAMMRSLGVSWPSATVAGVLYSLLPYHLWRQCHLFLSAYYLVPPGALIAIWIILDRLHWPWSRDGAVDGGRRRFYLSAVILLLVSAAGVYYAFFTCYLLVVAGVAGAINERTWRPVIIGAMLVALTAAGVLINVSPSLRYWKKNGANNEVAQRSVDDTEHLGLKVGSLILPTPYHRFARLLLSRMRYDGLVLGVGEQQYAALGAVGAAGFLFLLGLLFYRRPLSEQWRICGSLATLNMACVLLGTIGGFGSLFSLLVDPSIRAYNRISVFIALFALATVALVLDRLLRTWSLNRGGWGGTRLWSPSVVYC